MTPPTSKSDQAMGKGPMGLSDDFCSRCYTPLDGVMETFCPACGVTLSTQFSKSKTG